MHTTTRIFFFMCSVICILVSDTTYTSNYQTRTQESNPTELLRLASTVLQRHEINGGVLISHMGTFLQQACSVDSSRGYAQLIFDLFANKFKGTEYLAAYQFETFVADLPDCMQSSINIEKVQQYLRNPYNNETLFNRFTSITHNILYQQFSTKYDQFKANPDQFLLSIAEEITDIARAEAEVELLRHTVVRFLEICLSKLVWSPHDDIKTWESVKRIANQMAFLVERNIITDINHLDDLYWSLLYRYCYFLDIAGPLLSNSFFQAIKDDIATHQLLFLELEEQDPFMGSKLKHLQQTIMHTQARALIQKQGMTAN